MWMQTASFLMEKQDIYEDIQEDVEKGLTPKILNQTDHYLKEKIKKVIGLMKDELGWQVMKELRTKAQSYVKDNKDEDKKKQKARKSVSSNKKNIQKKNKIHVNRFKEDHKKFIKDNKLTLKTQQRFTNEKHNVFAEEIHKIALSSNGDEKIESIDSIKTNPYGMSKDLVCNKEEIKCNNIVKQYKNVKL